MTLAQVGKRPSYLIVGGGIAGCSLAYELSKHPFEVTLIEAGELGKQGASSVPLALLNPNRGRTARASDLDRNGLTAMQQLAKELENKGLEHGLHFPGVLRIAHNAKQQKKFAHLDDVKKLSPEEITMPYHAPFGGILIEEAGWLEPRKLLKALRTAAERREAKFIENALVKGKGKTEDGRQEILLNNGKLTADKIFFCTGASHNPSLDLPALERLEGDVISLDADLGMLHPIAGAVYGMQNGKQVFMGGNHRHEGEDDSEAIQRLKKSSSWFLKALEDAPIKQRWSGVRAKQEDNRPLITELEQNVWFFGAMGGRGFLCSYYLAQQLSLRLHSKE